MSKIPEKYICDIQGCDKVVPLTKTDKRDYISVHVARMTEDAGDRLYTLDEPKLSSFEIDLCSYHLQEYVNNLPIQAFDDGKGGVTFKLTTKSNGGNTGGSDDH